MGMMSSDREETTQMLKQWADSVNGFGETLQKGLQNLELMREAAPNNSTIRGLGIGFGNMVKSFQTIQELVGIPGQSDNFTVCGRIAAKQSEFDELNDSNILAGLED